MAKGYWIAFVDVGDPEAYKAYIRENAIPFAKYQARFVVRAGTAVNPEGKVRSRAIVIEFPDYQTALDCWSSPEYAKAKALRENASLTDLVIVEGCDGPPPGES